MADPKKPDPRDVQTAKQLVQVKQAETIARLKNAAAIKAEAAAYAAEGRALAQQSAGIKKAGDAFSDLADHADDAVEATDDLALSQKRSSSAFEKFEKAAGSASKAVDGMEASWRLMIAAHYDAIHAANMMNRAMQRELPKSAAIARASIDRLTGRFATLREKSTKVATDFIIPWEEAVADQDKLLEAFGTNLDGASDAALDTLVNLQRSIYAIREATGVSFEDQVRNIDYAITHLGMTAEDYQTQIEALARAPSQIAPALDRSSAAAKRYKDILKTNGIIAAVNDLVRALDMENVSVKKLSSSYGFLVEQSIKYGRSQRDTIAYAEKITKALFGVGNKSDLFQVGNFLGGEQLAAQLKASGLGGPNDAAAKASLRKKYLADMGVEDESKATQDQLDRANAKIEHLQDALKQGNVNAGALFQFASSEDILKSKLATVGNYQDLARGDTAGLAGTQVVLEQLLGAENVNAQDIQEFQKLLKETGGDQDELAKKLTQYFQQAGKEGFTTDEQNAQAAIAQQRKMAEAPDVIIKNALGPQGYVISALGDAVKSLTSIEGAVGFIAGTIGYAGGAASQNAGTKQTSVAQTTRGDTLSDQLALKQKIDAGTATPEELNQAKILADKLRQQGQQQANATAVDKLQADWDAQQRIKNDPNATAAQRDPVAWIASTIGDVLGKSTNIAGQGLVKDADRLDDSRLNPGQDSPEAMEARRKAQQQQAQPPPIPGHAAGLNYVPFDNYLARLHEGERIMTKQQAKMLRDAQMRAPSIPQMNAGQAPRYDQTSGSQANQIPKGNLPMEVSVDGGKLTFTVQDAGPALMELLARSRPTSIS